MHINRSSSISTDLPKLAKANQSVDIIKSFFKKVMCHDDGTSSYGPSAVMGYRVILGSATGLFNPPEMECS